MPGGESILQGVVCANETLFAQLAVGSGGINDELDIAAPVGGSDEALKDSFSGDVYHTSVARGAGCCESPVGVRGPIVEGHRRGGPRMGSDDQRRVPGQYPPQALFQHRFSPHLDGLSGGVSLDYCFWKA